MYVRLGYFYLSSKVLPDEVGIILPKWIICDRVDSMLQRIPFTSSGTKFQIFPALLKYEFVGCIKNVMGSLFLSLGKYLVSSDI